MRSLIKRWILYILLLLFTIPTSREDTPATGAANIGGLNFSYLFERAEIQIPVNKYECPQRLSFCPGNLFWSSFTNHNSGNYLRHGINITTNQRLFPIFRGSGNTIIVGDSQTHPLPIFPKGGGTSLHRLGQINYKKNTIIDNFFSSLFFYQWLTNTAFTITLKKTLFQVLRVLVNEIFLCSFLLNKIPLAGIHTPPKKEARKHSPHFLHR